MTEVAARLAATELYIDEAAKARVRRRYRAEARFKFYGLAAVGLTGLFLVVVLADILLRGIPALYVYRLTLDVTVDRADIDPQATGSAETLRGADYQAIVRSAVRALFPDVTDRPRRRLLDNLLSSDAGAVLRERIVADPGLIGAKVNVPVLLSADADLYFKNSVLGIERRPGAGSLTPDGTTGEITLASTSRDFAAELARIERFARRSAAPLAPDAAGQIALGSRLPSVLLAVNGGLVGLTSLGAERASGTVLLPLKSTAPAAPGTWQVVTYDTPEADRRLSDQSVAWLESIQSRGLIERSINWRFFTTGDSREPELAGIRGALVGSALTLLVTLVICVPLGVAAAIYLEEFAVKNRLTELVEVNINNLAAVPSIVFGIFGLAVFLNFFGLPRSAPLVGGLVLALLVLPTIIIAARAALKAVPPSIKEAALGVGASHQQAIFHHVLPLAMPGIMTGTIIGMAHALGETAPLLMIGMVAFIVEPPTSLTEAATVLPVQIYLWSDLPEIAFQAKTAAAIIVLLCFLFVMNGAAILLRRRFERRW